jgi:hypothetical protein
VIVSAPPITIAIQGVSGVRTLYIGLVFKVSASTTSYRLTYPTDWSAPAGLPQ